MGGDCDDAEACCDARGLNDSRSGECERAGCELSQLFSHTRTHSAVFYTHYTHISSPHHTSLAPSQYLQILVALLILVFSCVATAFIQPYETQWLNLLDTFGLLVLIVTQIVSILYFYVATAAVPSMNAFTIETTVTFLLLGINAVIICVLLGFFGIELFGLRQVCLEKRSHVFAVASEDRTTAALVNYGWGGGSSDLRWCHPNGVAVSAAPRPSRDGIWKWVDTDGVMSTSMEHPKLLLLIKSVDVLRPGADFHWVSKKSDRFSAVQTKPHDVGGYVCGGAKKTEEEGRVVVEGDVELAVLQHDNALARRRAADDGVVAVGDDVPAGGDAPAAAALLAAGPTVAELQASLQERDAALLEKDAENTQLRAEIEHLKQVQPGAVVEVGVAAKAAVQHPAVETPGEQCPRGWSSVSHHTGKYFNNDYTGETTYEKPMFPAPPEGWSVHAHGDEGHHYFQHDASGGGTQWHHPHDDPSIWGREEASRRGGGGRRKSVRAESRC